MRPLGEVLDARRHAIGVEGDAVGVQRRSEQVLGDTGQQTLRALVGHDDVPHPVDDDGWVGIVGPHQAGERLADAGHRLTVERCLRVPGGIAGRQQHRVALAQRDLEVLGEGEHELRRRLGLAGLDEAEVAGGDADVERQVQLAPPAVLPPVPQHRSDRRRALTVTFETWPRAIVSPAKPMMRCSLPSASYLATSRPANTGSASGVPSAQLKRTRSRWASTGLVRRMTRPGNCAWTAAIMPS